MTILVAGFSAFPGAPVNPCEALALGLGGSGSSSGEPVAAVVLPVEWTGSWQALRRALDVVRPRAVLLFGLHARAERLRIELKAWNARELGRVDAAGDFPSGPAVAEGPECLASRLPLSACARGLRDAGIDFELSQDAGRYLCNDTLFRLCQYGEAAGLDHWGFIHVPLTDESLDGWLEAGALPGLCRTVSADALRRAAMALVDSLDGTSA